MRHFCPNLSSWEKGSCCSLFDRHRLRWQSSRQEFRHEPSRVKMMFMKYDYIGDLVERPQPDYWLAFERIHFRLPDDYKRFISEYGTGILADFFCFWNPFAKADELNFLKQYPLAIRALRELRDEYPHVSSDDNYRLFPEIGGLLPFSHTANGDYLCWVTTGEPNDWKVMIVPGSGKSFFSSVGLEEFLDMVFTQSEACPALPDLTGIAPTFKQ